MIAPVPATSPVSGKGYFGYPSLTFENAALEKSEYLQYCVRFDESYTRKKWLMSLMELMSRSPNMPHSPGDPGM